MSSDEEELCGVKDDLQLSQTAQSEGEAPDSDKEGLADDPASKAKGGQSALGQVLSCMLALPRMLLSW